MSFLIEHKNKGGEGGSGRGKKGYTFVLEDLSVSAWGHTSAASSISVILLSAL